MQLLFIYFHIKGTVYALYLGADITHTHTHTHTHHTLLPHFFPACRPVPFLQVREGQWEQHPVQARRGRIRLQADRRGRGGGHLSGEPEGRH